MIEILSPIRKLLTFSVLYADKTRDASEETLASPADEVAVNVDLSSCDDVAIVGAGIAGSYAAWRLRNRGQKITVFEYSDRIGGRCHTIKFPGIPDVNIELGAMRFKPLGTSFCGAKIQNSYATLKF